MLVLRHQKILESLAEKESISVNELSQLLNVTEVTIRSDLTSLEKSGKVARTHGGAKLIEERVRQEYTFQTRKSFNSSVKQKIGEAAASFVNSSESIILDSSTTVLTVAQALRTKNEIKDVTVIPTGIWTAIELMGCVNINVLLPCGYLRHSSGSITGLPMQDFFNGLIIQKAFLGAWGISYENGLTDTHLLEIDLKKKIIEKVKEIIVLVDGSKFYQSGLASYASINQISKIITDKSAPEGELKKIEKQGIKVVVVN